MGRGRQSRAKIASKVRYQKSIAEYRLTHPEPDYSSPSSVWMDQGRYISWSMSKALDLMVKHMRPAWDEGTRKKKPLRHQSYKIRLAKKTEAKRIRQFRLKEKIMDRASTKTRADDWEDY